MRDATSAAKRQRAAVIYNPIKVDLNAIASVVAQEEEANKWDETVWLATSEDDPGQGRAKEALESGASVVILAGGDGTVHTAFTGVDRKIDLGLIEITRADRATSHHVFLVMAGLGLDAKMLANTDDDLKKKAGWPADVTALALTTRDKNELRFRYALDRGPSRATRAHTIIVANCGSLPSNIVLLPDAAVDDGEFDLALPPRWVSGRRPVVIFGSWPSVTLPILS